MDQTDFQDKELKCVECKGGFTFTAGEQRFFAERQFTPPRRCKDCRARRKAEGAVPQREGSAGNRCSVCGAPNPNKSSGLCKVCDFGGKRR